MLRSFPSSGLANPILHFRALAFLALLSMPPMASAQVSGAEKLKRLAADHEKNGSWSKAASCYEEILRRDRSSPVRARYLVCLRRLHVASRHEDPVYQKTLTKLRTEHALDAYEQVLGLLSVAYPDRAKTNLGLLFQQGLRELIYALDDPLFKKHYLAGVKPAAVKAFKDRLASWPQTKIANRAEARKQAKSVIFSAREDGVALNPKRASAFAMELAAGACNALDEYSAFLTPGNLALVQSPRVGIGVDTRKPGKDDPLQITRVYPDGPAQAAGLTKSDQIVSIDGKPVAGLSPEAATELLFGDADSSVEIELRGADSTKGRTIKLVRRAVTVPSVEWEPMLVDTVPVGYLKISYFADSTAQEIREALGDMTRKRGVPPKGLIIDLRGNPGGLFQAAVNVAEMFLNDGVIVISRSPFEEYNRTFKVESGSGFRFPVVVLIDGETASAAEVLAGALQAGRPLTAVMGQTSYGKGSIQCIIPMEKSPLDRPTGIRLTVAKLYSPSNKPYTGRGVIPDPVSQLEGEALLLEARKKLLDLINTPTMMPPKSPMMGNPMM